MLPKKFTKLLRLIAIAAFATVTITIVAADLIVGTTAGSRWLTRTLLDRSLKTGTVKIGEIDGDLLTEVTYSDIEVRNLKCLPRESVVKIQRVTFYLSGLNLKGITVKVENGRVQIPWAEPIVFTGELKKGLLNFNVYTQSVDVRDVRPFLPDNVVLKLVDASLDNIDAYLRGPLDEPIVAGKFVVDYIIRRGISLVDAPGTVNLQFKDIRKDLQVTGTITLEGGKLLGPKSTVDLTHSTITYDGKRRPKEFDIHGTSQIESTKINITLRGNLDRPDLKLTSDPSLSQDRLLLMLATGRNWDTTQASLSNDELDVAVVKDFLDYFLFSGSGSTMAKAFDVSAVSFKYNEQTKSIGVKKGLSKRIDVGYSVEEYSPYRQSYSTQTTQALESDYKVTRGLSVGLEHRFLQNRQEEKTTSGVTESPVQTDDRLLLKYKKNF